MYLMFLPGFFTKKQKNYVLRILEMVDFFLLFHK